MVVFNVRPDLFYKCVNEQIYVAIALPIKPFGLENMVVPRFQLEIDPVK